MVFTPSTQVRRDRSRCKRKIEAQIDAARTVGDLNEVTRLKARLQMLQERWLQGLNSRSAKFLQEKPEPTYSVG